MKGAIAIVAATAALASAAATPAKIEARASASASASGSSSASLPTVTVQGNGMLGSYHMMGKHEADERQLSSPAATDSTFAVSTTNREVHPAPRTQLQTWLAASETL